jgi:hypothetical protein
MIRLSMCFFVLILAVALGCDRPAATPTSGAAKTTETSPPSKSSPPGEDAR